MQIRGSLLMAAVGTALALASVAPASAQLARPQTAAAMTGGNDLVTQVQWRGGRGGWRGGGRGYYRGGRGVGFGIAAGALLGAGIAAGASPYYYGPPPGYYAPAPVYEDAPGGGDGDAYCMQRYRSYDAQSGTYLGYDGLRHPCP